MIHREVFPQEEFFIHNVALQIQKEYSIMRSDFFSFLQSQNVYVALALTYSWDISTLASSKNIGD